MWPSKHVRQMKTKVTLLKKSPWFLLCFNYLKLLTLTNINSSSVENSSFFPDSFRLPIPISRHFPRSRRNSVHLFGAVSSSLQLSFGSCHLHNIWEKFKWKLQIVERTLASTKQDRNCRCSRVFPRAKEAPKNEQDRQQEKFSTEEKLLWATLRALFHL